MPFFKLIYLVFSEDRVKEMNKFEKIINVNYPSLIINKYFNLSEPLEMLSTYGVMAPEYIFIEDLHMADSTYSTLRKICRLEKLSESKIVVFGSETNKLDYAKLRNCRAKVLKIPDYDNFNLNEISASLKQTFRRIE
ncbi:hypothetical protein ACLI09_08780 [Flavobacterium sp. RHBU_24]|uniref:hypothetical protein n=1 Tax=Flavobacterium sp. RHBU_24 TaxID=3391185 RepID=UPI0039856797